MWWLRCELAMWLDKQKDRLDSLAALVGPDGWDGWEKYDIWAEKRGYHKWLLKD